MASSSWLCSTQHRYPAVGLVAVQCKAYALLHQGAYQPAGGIPSSEPVHHQSPVTQGFKQHLPSGTCSPCTRACKQSSAVRAQGKQALVCAGHRAPDGKQRTAGMSTLASAATTRRPRYSEALKASALASKRIRHAGHSTEVAAAWQRRTRRHRAHVRDTENPSTSLGRAGFIVESMTCWEEPRWLIKAPMRWGKGSLRPRVKLLALGKLRLGRANRCGCAGSRSPRRCASASHQTKGSWTFLAMGCSLSSEDLQQKSIKSTGYADILA